MVVTNKRLLIFKSRGDSNRCTSYRGKPPQHDTYDSHASPYMLSVRFLQAIPVCGNLSQVIGIDGWILLLLRKSDPDSTFQSGYVARGTRLSFYPNTAIEAVGLTQASIDGRLLGLLVSYHRHKIGTFNTYSRVPTPRSLTDTRGGYYTKTSE
jgi:hypothetical protein